MSNFKLFIKFLNLKLNRKYFRMSEIYINKRPFWNENNQNNHWKIKNIVIKIGILIFIILFVFVFIRAKDDNKSNISNLNENQASLILSDYSKIKKLRMKCFILKGIFLRKCKETMNIGENNSERIGSSFQSDNLNDNYIYYKNNSKKFYNPILQSTINEQDYFIHKFNTAIRNILLIECFSESNDEIDKDLKRISKEIEIYYNFLLHRQKLEFEITNDYGIDYISINNQLCFVSGSAHLALKTISTPECIEFRNININNFYYTYKRDANIHLKFHIFKLNKTNKIDVYPVSKQLLNFNIIKRYRDMSDQYDHRNLLIYFDHLTGDKMIRICNILSNLDSRFYENNFWLNIVWNPEIQNLLCIDKINYIN